MNLNELERERYSKQLLMNEIGEDGQMKLKKSRVLVIGAGGLGSPTLMYLAAAGVGNIGIADFDLVELSNLQRQILYTIEDLGKSKALVAAARLHALNPHLSFHPIHVKITNQNALYIFSHYDLIIDGSDNFETRYIVNDACVLLGKPFIYGAVQKFEGQIAVFNFTDELGISSSTYRCLHPIPPAPGTILNCSNEGVAGVLPGIIGTMQATEAIKIITGIGEPSANKVILFNALIMEFNTIKIIRNESGWIDFPYAQGAFQKKDYKLMCSNHTGIEKVKSVSSHELLQLLNTDAPLQLIDVRNHNEEPIFDFQNNIRIPLNELHTRLDEIRTDVPIFMYCSSGKRSRDAAEFVKDKFNKSDVYSLLGGIKEWNLQIRK